MKEDFLHMVWESGQFSSNELATTLGDEVSIVKRGFHNFSSGPDFQEAQIEINGTLWAGSVEIHLKSSDWRHHKHSGDPAYRNVILHVVYLHDEEVLIDGVPIPTLELNGRIKKNVLESYHHLQTSALNIPCEASLNEVNSLTVTQWLDRTLVQRLERKSSEIEWLFDSSNGDWMQTFYALLLGYFGQNINKQPMLELAMKLPFKTIAKHIGDSMQVEALIFGVSGLLALDHEYQEGYAKNLKQEYQFLKSKYDLKEVQQGWKMGKVRPSNLPTMRFALFSAFLPYLIEGQRSLLSGQDFSWTEIIVKEHEFWDHHYSFSTPKKRTENRKVSKAFNAMLQINVHAPFQFFYGLKTGNDAVKQQAIDLLEKTDAESNTIIKAWADSGLKPNNAAQSQALIELRTQLCNHKKCVLCGIGKAILMKQ